MSKLFAAVDLGASSGRVIAAFIGETSIALHEIHRFGNGPLSRGASLYWDFDALKKEILNGLRLLGEFAQQNNSIVTSIGIDSWAVDYGLIDDEGNLIDGVRNYRDERNALGVAAVEQQISPEELYEQNGLQFLPFNTLYQLTAHQMQDPSAVNRARHMLLVPDLLNHWLTGAALTERTNASTTGLLCVATREWNWELIDRLGLSRSIFTELVDPGNVAGQLLPEFRFNSALENTVVTSVPSHDTAAAVAGTPLIDSDSAYLSSGTWSLLGLELERPNNSVAARNENFTNELGAAGRIRFLKNLSGLWLLQQSMLEFLRIDPHVNLQSLLSEASAIRSDARIDVTEQDLATPGDMPAKIRAASARQGVAVGNSPAAIVRCVLDSLADAYGEAVKALEKVSGVTVSAIQIVGGGSQNDLLSQLTADATGKKVIAGPVEATALGNLMSQAGAHGAAGSDLESQREIIRASFSPKIFKPSNINQQRKVNV